MCMHCNVTDTLLPYMLAICIMRHAFTQLTCLLVRPLLRPCCSSGMEYSTAVLRTFRQGHSLEVMHNVHSKYLCWVLPTTPQSQANCGRYDAALEKAKYNALALQQAAAAREDEVIGTLCKPLLPRLCLDLPASDITGHMAQHQTQLGLTTVTKYTIILQCWCDHV